MENNIHTCDTSLNCSSTFTIKLLEYVVRQSLFETCMSTDESTPSCWLTFRSMIICKFLLFWVALLVKFLKEGVGRGRLIESGSISQSTVWHCSNEHVSASFRSMKQGLPFCSLIDRFWESHFLDTHPNSLAQCRSIHKKTVLQFWSWLSAFATFCSLMASLGTHAESMPFSVLTVCKTLRLKVRAYRKPYFYHETQRDLYFSTSVRVLLDLIQRCFPSFFSQSEGVSSS